jgi:UrcA family protein
MTTALGSRTDRNVTGRTILKEHLKMYTELSRRPFTPKTAPRIAAITALLACAPAAVLAAGAAAGPTETATARVSLADLDLGTPAGLRVARERLGAIATRLCGKFADERRISSRQTQQDCVRDTLADALARLQVTKVAATSDQDRATR